MEVALGPLLPSKSEWKTVATVYSAVFVAATVQLGVALGMQLRPSTYVMPLVVATVISIVVIRLQRAQRKEQALHHELAQRSAEVERLNAELSAQVSDRTEALQAREAELFQAQKMEAVGRLAGGIAHDFNNLLTSVLQGSTLLEEMAEEPDTVRELAGHIQHAARRGTDLTRKLLTLSRKRRIPAPQQPVDLGLVLSELLPIVRRLLGGQTRLEVDIQPHCPALMGDRVHIEQVVLNLCVNARDAMPGGGRLRLSLRHLPTGAPLPDGVADGGNGAIELRVIDDGEGISEEDQARIFEPFYTTKAPGVGTGLGLSVVQSLVEGGGGRIAVESAPGQGATFVLTWPALDDAARPTPVAHPPVVPARSAAGLRILLIDDEPGVRRMLRRVLESRDHEVLEADGGDAAERIAREEGDTLDVVLSDVRMPGRSGPALVPLWHTLLPGARLLLMTGYTDEQNLDDASIQDLGVERVLRKPIEVAELDAALGQAVQTEAPLP